MNTNTPNSLQIKVSIKGRDLDTYHFSDNEIYIGRDPEANVVLDNPGVSRRHAKILRTANGLQIVDLKSGNGTFVNEQQVEQAELSSGDTIRISKFTLEVGVSAAQAEPAKAAASDPESNLAAMSEGTVFLQPNEREKVIEESRKAERPASRPRESQQNERSGSSAAFIFIAGMLFGMLCTWLFLN